MTNIFLFGELQHEPLRRIVLGSAHDDVEIVRARVSGYRVCRALGEHMPLLLQDAEGVIDGLLMRNVSPEGQARYDYYDLLLSVAVDSIEVQTERGTEQALIYLSGREQADCQAPPWSLEEWVRDWAPTVTYAVQEMMQDFGVVPVQDVLRRRPSLMARAASAMRARAGGPTTLRRKTAQDDVVIDHVARPYSKFFSVEDYTLRHRRFDGTMGDAIDRAAFVSCDAAIVLPYDPARDRVLLVEQFRMGILARGDAECWSLEAIAGRVDAGEAPEQTCHREAQEEAGLTLRDLIPVADYYPSPGAKTEFLYSFIGLADLPDTVAVDDGGVEGEGEDIRTHVIAFDRLMGLIETGEVNNGPLIVAALRLAQMRERLRSGA